MRLPADEQVEVHLVAVELRPVHADEPRPSRHLHPTSAAHARAVEHHAVQAHGGRDARTARALRHRLHHHRRPDGHHPVDPEARGQEAGEGCGYEASLSAAAVVGHHHDLVAGPPHLLLQDEKLRSARPQDPHHQVAGRAKRPRDRPGGRDPDPAPDHDHRPHARDLGRLPERPAHVGQLLPRLHVRHDRGRLADLLDHEGDCLAVHVGDREGDALGVVTRAHDHELARAPGPRHVGRQDAGSASPGEPGAPCPGSRSHDEQPPRVGP